jgi:N-acetyl-alpha-D-glucosaminyl L-malate synthase BshA
MSRQSLKIGITCYPTFGGSGVVATEIGMAMAERGHSVHFICYDVPRRLNRFTANVYFHEVEIRENPVFTFPPYALALTSKMVDVSTYEQLDLLHVHYAVPHATSAYLARQILKEKAPKVITTLHGTDITLVGNDRAYLPITRFSIMESDGVSAPSKYLKHATYDKLNIPTEVAIEVIPNFIDPTVYKPSTEKSKVKLDHCFGCADKKVLIHVSNFREVKRVKDVVQIFARVLKQVPCHLVLVGDGPDRMSVEALVRELKLNKDVSFLGKQDSTVEILQNSDLFILPSQNESFGLAALEAMSCGLPIIATKAEGIPEVTQDRETGYLSDVGDVDDMAKNAIAILTDSNLYQKLSKAGVVRAHTLFARNSVVDSYENFYYQVLGQR